MDSNVFAFIDSELTELAGQWMDEHKEWKDMHLRDLIGQIIAYYAPLCNNDACLMGRMQSIAGLVACRRRRGLMEEKEQEKSGIKKKDDRTGWGH